MTMRPHKLFSCCACCVAAAVLLYGGGAAAAELSVCIDSSSPMSGIDHQLAQAVAKHEGATLHVHEYNSDDSDEVNGMVLFSQLAGHDCALVLDFPLDTDAPAAGLGALKATSPYAHTGFALVTPKGSDAATLDQLPHGSKVALTYMTTPNLYMAEHPDLHPDVELHDPATLAAVANGKVSAAMVWQPALVQYQAGHAGGHGLAVHPLQLPHARFNLVALYDGAHAAAAGAFERAVASMQASGTLQKILGDYATAGPASASAKTTPGDPATDGHVAAQAAADDPPVAPVNPNASPSPKAAQGSGKLPALYTEAQATAGNKLFLDNCAMCHGADLSGGAGPALKGPHFATVDADFHVGDIFTIVSHNMPATEPASLPHDVYVKIMAFLLQQNGYPAGSQALTYEGAMKSKADFIYHGK